MTASDSVVNTLWPANALDVDREVQRQRLLRCRRVFQDRMRMQAEAHQNGDSIQRRKSPNIVMAVHDDVVLLRQCQSIFAKLDIAVEAFIDPIEALNWYAENYASVGLILLDINMPSLSGLECLQDMVLTNPACRVVFISATSDYALVDELIQEPQVYGFHSEPLDYLALVRLVKRLLQRGDQAT